MMSRGRACYLLDVIVKDRVVQSVSTWKIHLGGVERFWSGSIEGYGGQ
jgi:hypothetical protein